MGVKDLFKLINKNEDSTYYNNKLDDIGEVIQLKDLKNKLVLIDASIIIYGSLTAFNLQLLDKSNKITSHISTVLYTVNSLFQHDIQQIWIFDNKNRSKFKCQRKTKIISISDYIEQVKILLQYLGIQYLVSPPEVEAEQFASYMVINKLGHYVLSSDSDVLMFGGDLLRICYEKKDCTRLIQLKPNTNYTQTYKKKYYKLYRHKRVIKELGVSNEEFILMCLVLGTDFNDRVKGIGPGKVMSQYKSLFLPETFYDLFMYLTRDLTEEIKNIGIFENKTYIKEQLYTYLEQFNFSIPQVENILKDYKN